MFLGAASDNHKSMTGDSGTGMVHPALDTSHQVRIQHEYYSKTSLASITLIVRGF